MDKKETIILGIIICIAAIFACILFAPQDVAKSTSIELSSNNTTIENNTFYVKLSDDNNSSLGGKTLHIKLINNTSNVVYEKSVETGSDGIATIDLKNVSDGNYTIEIKFDGDGNYTSSILSQNITVQGNNHEEITQNEEVTTSTQEYTQSYDYSQDTSDSGSSSRDYDRDNEYTPIYPNN